MKVKRKILMGSILAAEAVVLFFLCAGRLRSSENDQLEYSADMLSMAQDTEEGLEMRETAYIDSGDQGLNRRIITPSFTARRGVYAVSVQYQSITSSVSSTGCHSQAVYDGEYPWIRSESVLLTNNGTNITYFMYVVKNNTDVKIKNIMDDGVYDPIQIDQINVTYLNGRSAVADVIVLLVIFCIFDVLLYFFVYRKMALGIWLQKNGLIVVGLCALLFVVELPMTMNYLPKGYDMRFHYYRIYSIAEGLRDGVFR